MGWTKRRPLSKLHRPLWYAFPLHYHEPRDHNIHEIVQRDGLHTRPEEEPALHSLPLPTLYSPLLYSYAQLTILFLPSRQKRSSPTRIPPLSHSFPSIICPSVMPPSSVNFRMWFDPLSSPRSYSTTISSTTRCLVLPESIFDNMINWLPIECSRQNVSDYCYMNHVHARSMSFNCVIELEPFPSSALHCLSTLCGRICLLFPTSALVIWREWTHKVWPCPLSHWIDSVSPSNVWNVYVFLPTDHVPSTPSLCLVLWFWSISSSPSTTQTHISISLNLLYLLFPLNIL